MPAFTTLNGLQRPRPKLSRIRGSATFHGRGRSSLISSKKRDPVGVPCESAPTWLFFGEVQADVNPAVFLPAFHARVVGEAPGLAEAFGHETLAVDAHVHHGVHHALGALLGKLHRLRPGALLVAGVPLDRGGDARV